MWLEPERAGRLRDGEARFYRLRATDGHLTLERWALCTELTVARRRERLVVQRDGSSRLFEPLDGAPPELRVEPYALPEGVVLEPDRLKAIRTELAERRDEDQRVRVEKDPAMADVDRENTAWLLKVVGEVGWIDAERFGSPAADAAFLIVQHSGDLRLMRTALGPITRDARAGRLELQSVALLWDRLELDLGYRQRYGSQLGVTAAGELVLMPLAEPEGVDARRAEMGLGPLADYLELFREQSPTGPIRTLEEALADPTGGR